MSGFRNFLWSVALLQLVRVFAASAAESADRRNLPIASIPEIVQAAQQGLTNAPVRLEATVTLHQPGRWLFASQGTNVLAALLRRDHEVRLLPGERVEIVGVPVQSARGVWLRDGIAQRTGRSESPPPSLEVSARQVVAERPDMRLLNIEGTLAGQMRDNHQTTFILTDEEIIFPCYLDASMAKELPAFEVGSRVRMTGVCSTYTGSSGEAVAFHLLLRSPADIHVVRGPSWWTPQRVNVALASALISMAVFGLFAASRVRAHRQELAARTASEGRLRDLYNNAPCGYHSLNADGVFVNINDTELKWLGYEREAVVGKLKLTDVITPESRETFARTFPLLKERGWAKDVGIEMVRRNGETFPVSISATAIKDAAGKFVMSRSTLLDITEERRQEEALATSEQRLNSFFSAATAGMAILDAGGRFVRINETLASIDGLSVQEHLGRRVREVVPHLADQIERVHREVIDRGLPVLSHEVVGETLARPGVRRCWTSSWFPLNDSGGEISGVGVVVVEITEQKLAQEAVKVSEERLRNALEGATEGIWDFDFRECTVYFSPRYYEMLGFEEKGFPATLEHFRTMVHDEDLPRYEAEFARCLSGESPAYSCEFRMKSLKGEWTWILSRGKVVERDSAGQPTRVVGTHSDITERKRLEEQLRHSQKMESIGRLAGGIAHDFNNILTVIQGHASLIDSGSDTSADVRTSAREIGRAADRAANLTRQLLTFSRKQVMQLRELDLNEIIGNLTRMLHRVLGEDVTLELNQAQNLPSVRADVGMIEQLVLNLAVNSRDAMPDGGKLILSTSTAVFDGEGLREDPASRPGRFVRLSVKDTGTGIAPEHLPRIFEPFFTTKEVGKGTGLGLATVYGIIQQHRGWITVKSKVGDGVAFDIYLPVHERSAEQRASALIGQQARGTETVLIVEDEPAVRHLAAALLRRMGYRVLEAPNGLAALEVWHEHGSTVDLVVTDMIMPESISGRELAAQLRAERADLKIIFTSGYTADATAHGLQVEEGVNFLQKPYHPSKLARIVRQALDAESLVT